MISACACFLLDKVIYSDRREKLAKEVSAKMGRELTFSPDTSAAKRSYAKGRYDARKISGD